VRLVAPIMSFTAEEIWSFLPKVAGRPESVHVAYFPEADEITGQPVEPAQAQALRADFDTLLSVRDTALKALEAARQEKTIGVALEAVVTFHAPPGLAAVLERYRSDLRFLLLVSGVEVKSNPAGNGDAPLRVIVNKAPGAKCERCWNYSVQVGTNERYPAVCERCLQALEEIERALPV
jgi:isoleucyl-tRNA synthetase